MSLLIRSVRMLCGPRPSSEKVDVFVSGDKISAIGNFPRKGADEVIEGQGSYLAPGFIDVVTHADHCLTLLDEPEQLDFLRQGVTTIVGGHCGTSLAPLIYGTLESLADWSRSAGRNVNWHSVKEFFAMLHKRPLGVNFATLIGHRTIREALTGGDSRDLTKNEMLVFHRVLREALEAGGLGVSFGLDSSITQGTPYQELKLLGYIAKSKRGIVATTIRDRESGAAEEIMRLREESGAPVLISALPKDLSRTEFRNLLARLGESEVRFAVSPCGAAVTPLYMFLPPWARRGTLAMIRKALDDEWLTPRILKDMKKPDPQAFRIARAAHANPLVGRTLADFMELYSLKDAKKALLALMRKTDLHTLMLHRTQDDAELSEALAHPASLIASYGAGASGNARMRNSDYEWVSRAFPHYLADAEKAQVLDRAVAKITSAPAQFFGFMRRGEIREDFYADLVVFREGDVKATVINGKIAWSAGAPRNVRAGKILRRNV